MKNLKFFFLIFLLILVNSCQKNETYIDHHTVTSHTVVKGESLSIIAEQIYGDSKHWIFIARWNNLSSNENANSLKVGQSLKLINPELKPKIHKLKKGENLTILSNKYSVAVNLLEQWNSKEDQIIYEDQAIIVGWETSLFSSLKRNLYFRYIFGFIVVIIGLVILSELFNWIEYEFGDIINKRIINFVCGSLLTIFVWSVGLFFDFNSIINRISAGIAFTSYSLFSFHKFIKSE